ncbi:MAG: ANTAR domain-containing protein [Actinomycetota bacterium]|nr:ANTAR domain-containing protein [Actinomycetota bacterium]
MPVFETDLAARPPVRWTGFAGPAVDAGIGAVFAFPLRLGAARLGALCLYQAQPGTLGDDSYADALIAADVITDAILTRQTGVSEEAHMAESTDDRAFHAQVHQASGMVSVQLNIGVGEALVRLRARAFSTERPVGDVAADVVAGRLRFDE